MPLSRQLTLWQSGSLALCLVISIAVGQTISGGVAGPSWLVSWNVSSVGGVACCRYYVDPSVSSSGNGLSWATAWKTLADITGLAAGDVVYLSGSTVSQTYSLTSPWTPAGGTSGHPITYAAGQDAGHNGTVIFDGGGVADRWATPASWVTLNGEYQGTRHFLLQNFVGNSEMIVFASKHGLRALYITFQFGDAVSLNASDQYEIAFSTMEATFDHAFSASNPPAPTGYDENLIHDNAILLDQKNDASGVGCDGFQNGTGVSFYNNIVTGHSVGAFPSGQHQDGVQTDGRFTRIYNNIFLDIANYAVFFEMFGNAQDMQVFNNVMIMSDTRFSGGSQQGVAIGRSGGATGTITFSRVLVLNNTMFNYGGVAIAMSSGAQSTWDSSDQFLNNAAYLTGGYSVDGNVTGNASATNVSTSTGGAGSFVAYQAPSGTFFAYDLHLKISDTTFRGNGTNLTSLGIPKLNADHDGIARPAVLAWDVGAYQH